MWDLSRLGICRLWRDRFKDLFPTLFLMSLGSSPSVLQPNIEETGANEPFSLSCAWCSQKSVQDKSREVLEGIAFIPCSLQLGRWALCQEVPGNSEKKKNGCDLLRQERSFKNKVEREKFLGLEGCWACLGLQKNTCPSQRERLLANPFSLWRTHSALPSVVSERAWGCGFLE